MLRVIHRLSAVGFIGFAALLGTGWGSRAEAQSALWIDDGGIASSALFDNRFPEHPPSSMPDLVAQPVGYQSAACGTCNSSLTAGSCAGTTLADGGCSVRGTNLFWCNPYADPIDNPCDYDACLTCADARTPLLFASVELVPLYRDQMDDPVFQRRGRAGVIVLENGDFDTDFDAGMRLTLGTTLTDRYRIEAAYMGNYEWSDRAAIRDQRPNLTGGLGRLYSPFANFGIPLPLIGADLNNFASVEMTSSFESVELNVRRRCCNLPQAWPYRTRHCIANSFLVGFRYLKVDEQFGYATQSALPLGTGAINRVAVDTGNDMYGVQIGMLSQFAVRWSGWIDFQLKGGIYHNEATLASDYVGASGDGTITDTYAGSDAHDRTSFLGEVSLTYSHQVTNNLSMRLGYNAFWLTGLALASENLAPDFNTLTRGPTLIEQGGNSVYHGPNLGFIFAY